MEHISLNGLWKFAYTYCRDAYETNIPSDAAFSIQMPVPGYWDDNLGQLKETEVWSRGVRFNPEYRKIEYPLGTGKPDDSSLPYLVGMGWYKRDIVVEKHSDSRIFLEIGEAVSEITIFINRKNIGCYHTLMAGDQINITEEINGDSVNELILAVSNQKQDILSTAYRGYKGFSGGISGNMFIKNVSHCLIEDMFAYPDSHLQKINIEVTLNKNERPVSISWELVHPDGSVIQCGQLAGSNGKNLFSINSDSMIYWTEDNPFLYNLIIEVHNNGNIYDTKSQSFGLRFAEVQGTKVLINKRPVFLRGLTEHAYFPLTCTAPLDKGFYRTIVKKYQEIGFSWIRFHTTVPHSLYMEACDELGMLVQIEAPNPFDLDTWEAIIRKCRNHPSVILYCGGNEERLTDNMMENLEAASQICKKMVPDALFSPMQALPYVDWMLEEPDVVIEEQPFRHNPKKLEWLRRFSDVLQPQKHIGFDKIESSLSELQQCVDFYKKPYMSHEVGLCDGYINLDLEQRYEGTRIGTSLYSGAREYLKQTGMIHNAAVYYQNSCRWSAVIRKIFIEKLRLCKGVVGYDYLGVIDCHWHRTGYTPGILNEFHEYKPGEGRSEILRYNGKNLILLDISAKRDYRCGETFSSSAFASIYEGDNITTAAFTVRILKTDGSCLLYRTMAVENVRTYEPYFLGDVRFDMPQVSQPEACLIQITFDSECCFLENQYSIWLYPDQVLDCGNVLVCTEADDRMFDAVEAGASALVLNPFDMKITPLSYTKMLAGRTIGNTATVVYDHPALNGFPHEGWCDLQFFTSFEGACSVVFDEDMPLTFQPIIEIVSSYKMIFKQAALFEFAYGKGKIMVCTLQINGSAPAQLALKHSIITYMNSKNFQPKQRLDNLTAVRHVFYKRNSLKLDYSQETGFDGNAVLLEKNW